MFDTRKENMVKVVKVNHVEILAGYSTLKPFTPELHYQRKLRFDLRNQNRKTLRRNEKVEWNMSRVPS